MSAQFFFSTLVWKSQRPSVERLKEEKLKFRRPKAENQAQNNEDVVERRTCKINSYICKLEDLTCKRCNRKKIHKLPNIVFIFNHNLKHVISKILKLQRCYSSLLDVEINWRPPLRRLWRFLARRHRWRHRRRRDVVLQTVVHRPAGGRINTTRYLCRKWSLKQCIWYCSD